MKHIIFALVLFFGHSLLFGQSKEQIEEQIATKKDSIASLEGRVAQLQAQIDDMPGWRFGAFGTVGGNISQFTNWYAQGFPNNAAGNIGFTINAFANDKQEKYFWRNALSTNLSWVKLDNKDDPDDDSGFQPANDVFNLTSLYGLKFSKKWAASTLVEYRTTILSNFHNPGYLDLGLGITWTPIPDLVVVMQPLNYNIVLSKEENIFESSGGAKIVADYVRSLGTISFKSNLSVFQSYRNQDLSNWTWTNSFAYTLWKMIGIGFDFGLRNNRQEALNYEINTLGNTDSTFETIDNDLQTYWTVGLSYSF